MNVMWISALLVFAIYRIYAGVNVWRLTKSKTRGCVHFLLDCEIFRAIFINIRLDSTHTVGLVKFCTYLTLTLTLIVTLIGTTPYPSKCD